MPTEHLSKALRVKLHRSVTAKRIQELAQASIFGESNTGLCLECGADAHGVEPDASKYFCESCNRKSVYGAELLLMYL